MTTVTIYGHSQLRSVTIVTKFIHSSHSQKGASLSVKCKRLIPDMIFYINDSFKLFYIALSGIIFNVHEKNISLIFYGFMTVKNV